MPILIYLSDSQTPQDMCIITVYYIRTWFGVVVRGVEVKVELEPLDEDVMGEEDQLSDLFYPLGWFLMPLGLICCAPQADLSYPSGWFVVSLRSVCHALRLICYTDQVDLLWSSGWFVVPLRLIYRASQVGLLLSSGCWFLFPQGDLLLLSNNLTLSHLVYSLKSVLFGEVRCRKGCVGWEKRERGSIVD